MSQLCIRTRNLLRNLSQLTSEQTVNILPIYSPQFLRSDKNTSVGGPIGYGVRRYLTAILNHTSLVLEGLSTVLG